MALSTEGIWTLGHRSAIAIVNGGLATRLFYPLCESLSETDLDLLLSVTGGSTDTTFVECQQLVFNTYVHVQLVPGLRVAGDDREVTLRLKLEHISDNLQASTFVFCTHTVTLQQLPALLDMASRLQAAVDICTNLPSNVRQALCFTKVLTEDCIMVGRGVYSNWEAAYRALGSALQTEVPVDIAWHSRVQDLPLRAQELLTFQEDAVREAKRLMDRAYSGEVTHIELVEEIAARVMTLLAQPGAAVHGGPLQLYYCTFTVLMGLLSPEWNTEVMEGLVLQGLGFLGVLLQPEEAVEEDMMPFSDADIDAQLSLAMEMGVTAYHAGSALG